VLEQSSASGIHTRTWRQRGDERKTWKRPKTEYPASNREKGKEDKNRGRKLDLPREEKKRSHKGCVLYYTDTDLKNPKIPMKKKSGQDGKGCRDVPPYR